MLESCGPTPLLDDVDGNKKEYGAAFELHQHIQKAKDVLINTLNQHQEFKHVHAGEPANPDAYIPENKQKKKLVINERFKRLLRNINK